MTGLQFTSPGGIIVSNYGTTTLLNNTQATRTVTVPNGRRWILHAGHIHNADNVARNCTVSVYDAGANFLFHLLYTASLAAGAYQSFPTTVATAANLKFCTVPLLTGWYLLFTWAAGGASAGGTATSTVIVLEVPA